MSEPTTPEPTKTEAGRIRNLVDQFAAGLHTADEMPGLILATLDAARAAAPSPEPRTTGICPNGCGHEWWTVGDDSYDCRSLLAGPSPDRAGLREAAFGAFEKHRPDAAGICEGCGLRAPCETMMLAVMVVEDLDADRPGLDEERIAQAIFNSGALGIVLLPAARQTAAAIVKADAARLTGKEGTE